MTTILLIAIILCSSVQQTSRKSYNMRVQGGVYSFSAGSAFIALLFFAAACMGSFHCTTETVGYAVVFSFLYTLTTITTLLAIQAGSLSLTSLVVSYSMVVPALYGIFFMDEKVDLILIIGIILLLLSLILINLEGKKEEKKITFQWAVYAFITFVGNGSCTTVQRVYQLKSNGAYSDEFMVIALSLTVAVLIICSLLIERKKVVPHLKKGFIWYLLCGLGNGMVNLLILALSLKMPASVLYPLISAGSIVFTAVISVFVYKEKLTAQQKLGFLLGTAAVVALNL